MKKFKLSREDLKAIKGGANTTPPPGNALCPKPGHEQVRCVDPYSGEVSWQCTFHGDPRLCLVLTPV